MTRAEKRTGQRWAVRSEGFRFFLEGSGPLEVSDLGPRGASFVVADASPFTDRTKFAVRLCARDATLFDTAIEIANVSRSGADYRVGARFTRLSPDDECRLWSSLVPVHERVKAREELASLPSRGQIRSSDGPFLQRLFHHYLFTERRPLVAFSKTASLRSAHRVEDWTHSATAPSGLALRITPSPPTADDLAFGFATPDAWLMFRAGATALDAESIALDLPDRVEHIVRRATPRIHVSEPVAVVLTHPRHGRRRVSGQLVEVSDNGMTVFVDATSGSIFPGDHLRAVEVRLPSGRVRFSCAVRGVNPGHHDGFHLGLEIDGASTRAAVQRWHDFVFRSEYPESLVGRRPLAESAFSVLESSRYVSLWTTGGARDAMRNAFMGSWTRGTEDCGCLVVSNKSGTPAGTIAGSLVYPHTWLVHHLGVRDDIQRQPRSFLDTARNLYTGIFAAIRQREDVRALLFYFENDRRWTEQIYREFERKVATPDQVMLTPMHVLKCATTDSTSLGSDELRKTRRATPHDLDWLAERLRAVRSPLEIDALAYDRSCIDLRAFARQCMRKGYERRRDVFVVLRDGVPSGALVAESGSEGTNLFGLMNRAWFLDVGLAATDEEQSLLVRRAKEHYTRLGKSQFLVFAGGAMPPSSIQELGLEFVSEGLRWLIRAEALPLWRAHINEVLARRPLRPAKPTRDMHATSARTSTPESAA